MGNQFLIQKHISETDKNAEIIKVVCEKDQIQEVDRQFQLPNLKLEETPVDNSRKQIIYIKQPYWDPEINLLYSEFPELESFIKSKIEEARNGIINSHYRSSRITGSVIFNHNHQILGWGVQDVNKHRFLFDAELIQRLKKDYFLNDEDISHLINTMNDRGSDVCVREIIKHESHKLSQPEISRRRDFYEICPGCSSHNHGEPPALEMATKKSTSEELASSQILVYNHWWSCHSCQDLLKSHGIKTIHLSKTFTKDYLQVDRT